MPLVSQRPGQLRVHSATLRSLGSAPSLPTRMFDVTGSDSPPRGSPAWFRVQGAAKARELNLVKIRLSDGIQPAHLEARPCVANEYRWRE